MNKRVYIIFIVVILLQIKGFCLSPNSLFNKPHVAVSRTDYIQVDEGLNVYYEIHGAGEPLVLIHGSGQNSEIFSSHVDFLKKHFKVILVDLRGHGKSSYTDKPTGFKQLAQDIRLILQKNNLKNAHVVGFSFGGLVASQLSADNPGLIKDLMIINTYSKSFIEGLNRWRDNNQPLNYRFTNDALLEWNWDNLLKKLSCPVKVIRTESDVISFKSDRHNKEYYDQIAERDNGEYLNIRERGLLNDSHNILKNHPEIFRNAVLDFFSKQDIEAHNKLQKLLYQEQISQGMDYYTEGTKLIKSATNFKNSLFNSFNSDKINGIVMLTKCMNSFFRAREKVNKYLCSTFDTMDTAFYSSSDYRDALSTINKIDEYINNIGNMFFEKKSLINKTKVHLSLSEKELFGEGEYANSALIPVLLREKLAHDQEHIVKRTRQTLDKHSKAIISTDFSTIIIKWVGKKYRVSLKNKTPLNINNFLKQSFNEGRYMLWRKSRRWSTELIEVVTNPSRFDNTTDTYVSTLYNAFFKQIGARGNQIFLPVFQNKPNTNIQEMLKDAGLSMEQSVLWKDAGPLLKKALNKQNREIDEEKRIFNKKRSKYFLDHILTKTETENRDNTKLIKLAHQLILSWDHRDNYSVIKQIIEQGKTHQLTILLEHYNDMELLNSLKNLYLHIAANENYSEQVKSYFLGVYISVLEKSYPMFSPDAHWKVIERITWDNRLEILHEKIAKQILSAKITNPDVLDIGCSNGITSINFSDILNKNGIEHNLTAADAAMNYFEVIDEKGSRAFFDAFGNLLQIKHGEKVYSYSDYDLYIIWDNVFNAVSEVKSHKITHPKAAEYENNKNYINFRTADIFAPLDNKYDVITVYDVLRGYYTKEQVQTALINLGRGLNDGGILMIGGINRRKQYHYTLYRREGDSLEILEKEGMGSGAETEQQENILNNENMFSLKAKRIDLNTHLKKIPRYEIYDKEELEFHLSLSPLKRNKKISFDLIRTNNSLQDLIPARSLSPFISELTKHHHKDSNVKVYDGLPVFSESNSAGSTSTLIAEKFLAKSPLFLSKDDARFLLRGILFHTVGLKSQKTTDKDRKIAEILAKIAGIEDINNFFTQFESAFSLESKDIQQEVIQNVFFPNKEWAVGKMHVLSFKELEATEVSKQSKLDQAVEKMKDVLRKDLFNGSSVFFQLIANIKDESSRLLVVFPEEKKPAVSEFLNFCLSDRVILEHIMQEAFAEENHIYLNQKLMNRFLECLSYKNRKEEWKTVNKTDYEGIVPLQKFIALKNLSEKLDFILQEKELRINMNRLRDLYTLDISSSKSDDGFNISYLRIPGFISRTKSIITPMEKWFSFFSGYMKLSHDIQKNISAIAQRAA